MKLPHTLKYEGPGSLANTAVVILEEVELVSKTGQSYDVLIEDEVKRIVDDGICSKLEMDQRIEVMKANNCSEKIIYMVLAQTRAYEMPVRTPRTIYQNTEPKAKTPILKKCLMEALLRHGVVYEGDKSVGKNVCAETVAWLLGMPYYMVTFNRRSTMGEISGEKTTAASRLSTMTTEELVALKHNNPDEAEAVVAKGQTINLTTEEGELVQWLKSGGLIMFNEMNMAEPNLLQSFCNPLADGTGFVILPGHGRVDMNPDCTLVGSQNPGYAGSCNQNNATLSRLGKISFPYPDSIKPQLKAATNGLGLKDAVYNQADQLYKAFHDAVGNGSNAISDNVLNIRGFVRALESFASFPDDYTLAEAIQCHVAAWANEDEKLTISTLIKGKITI